MRRKAEAEVMEEEEEDEEGHDDDEINHRSDNAKRYWIHFLVLTQKYSPWSG